MAKNSTWATVWPVLGVAVALTVRLLPVATPALLAGALRATVGDAVIVMLTAAEVAV